jgi:pimeloyl-ACP methyl ester carboxylesterase
LKTLRLSGRSQISLSATADGEEESPPVLLLHGGGQTRFSWNKTGAKLASSGFYAIALDARGHGDSDWCPEGDYRLDDFKADLLEVIRALNRPVHLVGASLGGITSLLVTAEENDVEILSLTLVDVATSVQKAGVDRVISFMQKHPHGFASLDEVANAVAEYLPHRKDRRSKEGLLRVVREREDGRFYWHWDPAFLIGKGEKSREDAENTVRSRLESAAKTVTQPTLLLRGRQSDVVSVDDVAAFKKLVPHAETADVKEAGHMIAGDSNTVFSALLEKFLLKYK